MNATQTEIGRSKPSRNKEWSRLTVGGTNKQGNIDRIRNLDGYHTPPQAVDALLDAVDLKPRIWEPANGFNRISDVLSSKGYRVHRSDIYKWSNKTSQLCDFTNSEEMEVPFKGKNFDIVTNPPFVKAGAFVEAGMDYLLPGGRLCLLLRLQFLEGQKRKKLFTKYPPEELLVFSARLPRMHRFDFDLQALRKKQEGEGKKFKEPGSALAFGWFIWQKQKSDKAQRSVKPTIRWL